MNKKDITLELLIGALVGLLVQPVLTNSNALGSLSLSSGLSLTVLRAIVFLVFLIGAPVALLLASVLSRFVAVIYQVAKFASVGVLNSFIDLGLFNLIGLMIGNPAGGSMKFIVMKSITFLLATTNSYFWNRLWTFGSSGKAGGSEAVKFYIVTGINWFVNVGVATGVSFVRPNTPLWVNVVAPVCGILAGMVGNFLGYKFVVFKADTQPARI